MVRRGLKLAFAVLLWLLVANHSAYCQHSTRVYLKDGSNLQGKLLQYQPGAQLQLRLPDGTEILIEDAKINRIITQIDKERKAPRLDSSQHRYYHSVYFSGNIGENHYQETDWGIGLEYVFGYWLSDRFSLGVGSGLIQYSADYSWRIIPIVLDMKWKGQAKNPFYLTGDFGAGFPLRNNNLNIIGGTAGKRIRLGLGKHWTLRSLTNINLEVSYLYQQSTIESYTWGWWNTDILTQRLRFQRYQLRFGFLF